MAGKQDLAKATSGQLKICGNLLKVAGGSIFGRGGCHYFLDDSLGSVGSVGPTAVCLAYLAFML